MYYDVIESLTSMPEEGETTEKGSGSEAHGI